MEPLIKQPSGTLIRLGKDIEVASPRGFGKLHKGETLEIYSQTSEYTEFNYHDQIVSVNGSKFTDYTVVG